MEPDQKVELVIEFCNSVFELKYRIRKMIQLKLKGAGMNISFEVLEVIRVLRKQDGQNQQELADQLFKDKSTMTYLVDNMVKAGLVVRKEDQADRRNKLIFLTDKSRELREQIRPLVTQGFLSMAEDITEREIIETLKMVGLMNDSLERQAG
jgi:DNA-binding MarR family transcriptional regulator